MKTQADARETSSSSLCPLCGANLRWLVNMDDQDLIECSACRFMDLRPVGSLELDLALHTNVIALRPRRCLKNRIHSV
jgi:hypothetical protein